VVEQQRHTFRHATPSARHCYLLSPARRLRKRVCPRTTGGPRRSRTTAAPSCVPVLRPGEWGHACCDRRHSKRAARHSLRAGRLNTPNASGAGPSSAGSATCRCNTPVLRRQAPQRHAAPAARALAPLGPGPRPCNRARALVAVRVALPCNRPRCSFIRPSTACFSCSVGPLVCLYRAHSCVRSRATPAALASLTMLPFS
jgi:hypothetical protein